MGEGGRARDGFPGSGSARSAAKAGEGAAKRSSYSPRGGRRRRRSRSPCSGWGAVAVGVPKPECGRGPTGRSGPGGSGTAQGEGGHGRGGVARAGGDGGVAVSRRRLTDPEPESSQRTEWRMQPLRPALWRGGRGTVGGGGGDSEREPDRLPDLTPSSARVSGGRAGAPRGSSGTVVRVVWTSSCRGCGPLGALHYGSGSPWRCTEAAWRLSQNSNSQEALRQLTNAEAVLTGLGSLRAGEVRGLSQPGWWGRGGSSRATRGGVEQRPGSRRAVARALLSPVGPQLRPLWGGGVPAARAGWGRAADVREGGAHLFSRPRAFSWRYRETAALGLAGSLVGARCARRKMGPNSGTAPRRHTRAGFGSLFVFSSLTQGLQRRETPSFAFPGIRGGRCGETRELRGPAVTPRAVDG